MKTLFICVALGTCFVSQAQTNSVIDLKHRSASFKDLQGRRYDKVVLVKADLEGLYFSYTDAVGGGRVILTNLSPATLESIGIPTNRIAIAAERVKAQAQADAKYKQSIELQHQLEAEQTAKWIADFEKNAPKREAEALLRRQQARQSEIDQQEEIVKQLERQHERISDAWVRGSGAIYTIGGPSDPNVLDAKYYSSKAALREARERLEDLRSNKIR